MHTPSRRVLLGGALAVAAALAAGAAAVQGASDDAPDGPTTVDVQAVQYPAPDHTADRAPAWLAADATSGAVTLTDGPFTDRVRLDGARLTDAGAAVTGQLVVTSDVSELLALEVTAWFYDAAGRLVGTGQQVVDAAPHTDAEHGAEHGFAPRSEGEPVALQLRAPQGVRAHSAVLSVPVLVNE